MTICLSNKYTKNYCDRTILVQVIFKDVVAYFFLKHGLYTYVWTYMKISTATNVKQKRSALFLQTVLAARMVFDLNTCPVWRTNGSVALCVTLTPTLQTKVRMHHCYFTWIVALQSKDLTKVTVISIGISVSWRHNFCLTKRRLSKIAALWRWCMPTLDIHVLLIH